MIPDLHTQIAGVAKRSPHSLALLACGRKPASYENLLNQMEQTARWLAFNGIGRGDKVAVVMPNGPEMASLFLGVASVSTCAPLNPAYKSSEFEFYLSDLNPKLIIVDAAMESAVSGAARSMDIEIVGLRCRETGEAGSFDLGHETAEAIQDVALDYATADDVALVLHTSGTTSRPKIVPLTHENLCVSAANIAESLTLTTSDRCLNIMPLFHVHGLVGAVLSSLTVGASTVCSPGYNATEFYSWLAEFRPTWYTGVPTMHHGILARAESNRAVIAANPLRFIRSCSSALSPKIMVELEKTFGAPVLEAYGMTEAAHQMSCNGLPPRLRKPGSVGRPTGVEVAIMTDAGTLLPNGGDGEVVIQGRNVFRGYENNPEADQKSFTNGWFRTGDQGRFDRDGDLFLTGRIKELIVRGGEKIAPREIDEVLLSHPAVEQALGFAVPDAALGERVAAAVVLKGGASATESELCEHAASLLADFKVPERIVFIAELPKGPTGKPQRIGLAERLGLSVLVEPPVAGAVEYCEPRNSTETRLAEMWCAVLKAERTGIHDNFFDSGGDSILASQLSARIRQTFGVELSAPRMFQLPTIANLAEFIREHGNGNASNLRLPSISTAGGVVLTSAQQRMWFLWHFEPESPVYNRPFAYRLKGTLDLFRLQQSLSALVQRHDILRTNYRERDGIATGIVREARPLSVALVDLSSLPAAQKDSSLQEWMRQEAAHPFNLETDPMLRCLVARLAPDENILLLVMHHIACDASTETALVEDMASAYNGTLPLGPCPQYSDYAAWQNTRQTEVMNTDLAWWKQQLAAMDEPTEFPADFTRPKRNRYECGTVPLRIDATTFQRCKALARAGNTTIFTVLLAAFDVLLYRYTGVEDIVIGTPVAVRNHPATESMVGLFINTLVLRTNAGGDPTFHEFIERVRETVAGGLAHQEVPFDAIMDALRPERSVDRSPLFQLMFEYRNIDKPHLAIDGITAERITFDRGFAPFDLTLDIEPFEDGELRGDFYYNVDLFERPAIERLTRHFKVLLGDVISSPDKKLSQLCLTTMEEQAQMLVEWNSTQRAYPKEIPLATLVEAQAARTPDAIAVVCGEQRLTYRGMNEQANQLACEMRKHGAGPDKVVGLCVERSTQLVVALLAIVKAGAAYLPLDPALPAERILFMLEDSGVGLLVTERSIRGDLPAFAGATILLEDQGWRINSRDNLATPVRPEDLAYVIYTSGSTGKPKGVEVPRFALTNLLWSMREWLELSEHDRLLAVTTISFDIASVDVWLPLLVGARIVMASRESAADGNSLRGLLERHGITFLQATPTTWQLLVNAGWQGKPDLQAVCTGEAMPVDLPAQLVSVVKRVWNMYGPTETTIWSTGYMVTDCRAPILIGRQLANTQCYILDAQRQPVPIGVTGELYIGGDGLARGYRNRPELTAEKFVAHPFATDGVRLYRTGDLARYRADGNIECLGRIDHQIKIRGYRIELGEIEARLAACPGVRDAVVVAREDIPGNRRLIAYFTNCKNGHAPKPEELRSRLSESLPEYMVPADYVRMETLPLSSNGKLNRNALPAPAARDYSTSSYVPPKGEIETAMATIWAEILRLDHVGKHDNFFHLGGNSLLAVTLISRMRRAGFKLDVRTLFTAPTVAELAATLDVDIPAFKIPENLIALGGEEIEPEMLPLVALTQEEIDRIVDLVPGGAANVQDIYPLAPWQEGILFHHLMEREGDPYLLVIELSFDTRCRLDRYVNALQAVIDRHDIFRTAVLWEGLSEPVQVVWRKAPLHVEEVEVDSATGDASETFYARFNPRHFRIDVRHAPLLYPYIAYDSTHDRWLMVLLLHHLAFDHTTLEAMQNEIRAHLTGEQNQLPAPLPFRNFVAQTRIGPGAKEHETFFRQMLGNVDEPTAFYGLLDVQSDGSGIDEAHLTLDGDLAMRLRSCARRLDVSAASIFHLAWAQVLARFSGRLNVVFGTILLGRMQGGDDADRIMGPTINTLPVLIPIGEEGVEASVERTHNLLMNLILHEYAPMALAKRCSAVPAPTPLFSTLLNYRHTSGRAHTPSGIAMEAWEGIERLQGEERNNYPVTLLVDDLGQGFVVTARTPASIAPMRICEFMSTALLSLIEALQTSPAAAVRTLDILPASERRRMLCDWNATETRFSSEKCVHQLFEEQVFRTPDATAVRFEDVSLSYDELNRRANRLAHYLVKLGVKPDSRVAICVERSIEMVVALLAVLKAGGSYVPLDPAYPVERLRFMLEDSEAVVLLTRTCLAGLLPAPTKGLKILDLSLIDTFKDQPETNPDRAEIGSASHHLAYIIYTSGSTGNPKGVMVEHGNLSNYLNWANDEYYRQQGSGSPTIHSISFDGLVTTLFGPLIAGQPLTLLAEATEIESIGRACLWDSPQYTLIKLTPSHLKLLNRVIPSKGAKAPTRTLMIGGEAIVAADVAFWQRHFPGVRLVNHFGPTETTVGCCTFNISASVSESSSIPIGRPIANTRIYILDVHGKPVPIGVPGELYIGGAGVARGYLNQPELTAERFLPDPFAGKAGARMYRTGDIGRWLTDGNIEFLGRNDSQVKIRGFRIELGEIETQLVACPGVRDAIVIARQDTPDDTRLVAYYTSSENEDAPAAQDLRSRLSANLPAYMIPTAYVRMKTFPLTPNGKLDRKSLLAPSAGDYSNFGYEPLQGEIEIAIAEIWAEVLNLELVGKHDNFFDLGGHSLLAVRIVTRVQKTLRVEVTVRDLFTHPVLSDLVSLLQKSATSQLPPIEPTVRSEQLPLSFAQQRLWFLAQMESVREAYHIPIGFRLTGELDREALRKAFDRIISRHESLRTTFALRNGEPVQRVASVEHSRFRLIEHDLRCQIDVQTEFSRLSAAEATAPFDLENGPLIRARLVRLANTEYALLITMHHIISDDWSRGVLLNELSALYRPFLRGETAALPELAIQYADYSVWQRRWIEGEILQHQAAYWRTALACVRALLDLPADHPRPGQQDYAGNFAEMVIDQQLTAGLKRLSRRHGATLYITLLAAWAALLARLSGQLDVVIGSPVANRGRAEIENLIGFFLNTLAVRLDLSGSPTVSALLEQAKAQVLAALTHQDIPFEHVVEITRPERSMAHSPLFQHMFAWQSDPGSDLTLAGLEVAPLPQPPRKTAKFDLLLSLHEAADTITGGIEYATSLFERPTIERYLGYFRNLLEAMVADDARVVDTLPMLPDAERHSVLYEWNDTRTEFPANRCVHSLFEEQVSKTPNAVAVVFEGRDLGYAELNRRANQLAHFLREQGVRPDARVAICVERGFEMIVALLAVLKAGGAYVPFDPDYPVNRIHFMMNDSGSVALLTQSHLLHLFSEFRDTMPVIDLTPDTPAWTSLSVTNPNPDPFGLTPANLAYVIYTSGSTGVPKGVEMPHRALVNLLAWQIKQSTSSSPHTTLQMAALGFDVAFQEVFGTLCAGAKLVLIKDVRRLGPTELLNSIIENRVERLFVPYNALRSLTEGLASIDGVRIHDILADCTLKEIITAGEQLRIEPCIASFFEHLEHCTLQNQYGPTETHVVSSFRLSSNVDGWPVLPPIGRPITNARIYILDANGQPVPVGVAGELYIGGAGVARGYLNRPELTPKKFLADPFSREPGARMYRTGDLGRWLADGNIEFLGRNDFQVKIRGFRVELGEIEAQLAAFSGVRNATVIACEDTPGDKRLVAYYTSVRSEGAPSAEELRSHLSANMPQYMVPAAYVRMETLPLTPNGKLDRKLLPPPAAGAYSTRGYEPPQGEIETAIAAIWSEILNFEHVGRQDDFFHLGGHSLLIVKLLMRVEQGLGVRLPVATLFQHSTLHEFSHLVVERIEADTPRSEIRSLGPLLWVEGFLYLRKINAGLQPVSEALPQWFRDTSLRTVHPSITMEDLARAFVGVIRERYPEGPYLIAGYCNYGVLAYEIAQQLRTLGCDVALLAIVESTYPEKWSLANWIKNRLLKDFFHVRALIRAPVKEWPAYLHRRLTNISVWYDDWRWRQTGAELSGELTGEEFEQALRFAIKRYRPRPYTGRFAYFQAKEWTWKSPIERKRKWQSLVTKNSDFCEVPGGHESMLKPPHVEVLAERLRQTILKVAAERSRDVDAGTTR